MVRRWTPAEDELAIRLWHEGCSFREISEKIGRTYDAVRTRMFQKHGLSRTKQHPLTAEQRKCAEALWRHGLTTKQIAARIGVDDRRLATFISKHRRYFPYRYDVSGADWVPAAIEMWNQGMTQQQIADKCGVNRWVVQRRLAIAKVEKPEGMRRVRRNK